MTVIQRVREVSFSCEQMFQLVNNVDDYRYFLPYCSGSETLHRSEDEVIASLTIAAAGFSKSFTTRNLLQQNKMIEIRLVEGPFQQLEGFWRFDKTDDNGCKISFDLSFEMSGRLLSMMLGPVFEQVTQKMIDSFCDRAKELYAKC